MSGSHPVSMCIWWRVGFWGLSAGPRPIGIPKRLKARGALYIRDNRPFGLFRTFTSGKGYGFFSFGERGNKCRLIAYADTFGHLTSIAFMFNSHCKQRFDKTKLTLIYYYSAVGWKLIQLTNHLYSGVVVDV